MDPRTLRTTAEPPDSPAWEELTRLVDRRAELAAGVDRLDAEQRAAFEPARAAGARVADIERRLVSGEPVSESERDRAAKALGRAKAIADAPWAERRQGHGAAVVDADQAIQRFIAERFDDLVEGLQEQGRAAADAVDAAAHRLLAAYHEREDVAGRLNALASSVRPVRPGDVSYSKAEKAARACEALLQAGGERPAVLAHDPRRPRNALEAEAV